MKYFTPSEGNLRVLPLDWMLWLKGKLAARRSGGAHQGQGGAVVAPGRVATKSVGCIQDGSAQVASAAGRGGLEKLLDVFEIESLAGRSVVPRAVDYSARNQQQRGAFLHADGRSVAGGVGEESERQAGRSEFGDAAMVAKKAGCVSGIGVAECAELLVIAGDEGGAGVNGFGVVDESAIDAKTELGHGIGFIHVGMREKLGSGVAKDLLCDCEDRAVLVTSA